MKNEEVLFWRQVALFLELVNRHELVISPALADFKGRLELPSDAWEFTNSVRLQHNFVIIFSSFR